MLYYSSVFWIVSCRYLITYLFIGESGHYYCGLRVLTCPCCDGICGPQRGCNCGPCQKLDKDEAIRIEIETKKPSPSQPQIESWVWGPQTSNLV